MLLTPPEAASTLRVSVRMVYSLMAPGAIQSREPMLSGGHKTTQSTRRYAHLYPEAQSAALATIFRRKA